MKLQTNYEYRNYKYTRIAICANVFDERSLT